MARRRAGEPRGRHAGPGPRAASRAARVLLVLGAIFVTLAILEIGARVWLSHVAGDRAFGRYASLSQLRARYGEGLQGLRDERSLISQAHHRYLGYYPTPGYSRGANRHNALGYRGEEIAQPKPPGELRIVCLGGSTTYSATLEDWRLAYPHLLQEELRRAGLSHATVVNAGVPGWSSHESLVNLALRVLDLDPDVIVVYHGINDVDARLVWPPERYAGDNSGRRKAGPSGMFMPGVLEYSTLARIALVSTGRSAPHSALQRTVDPAADSWYGDEFLEQKRDGTYPSGIFAEASASEMLSRNRPTHFRRNLESMVALARGRGIVPVLVTFASSPHFPAEPRASSPEYVAAYAEMNDVVREVAAAARTPLVDLARRMPQDPRLYVDGYHMTAEGSLLMARAIADELGRQGLLR